MASISKLLITAFLCLNVLNTSAQIGIGTLTPHKSSILDVSSTKKGFLPPRLTKAKRDAIVNAAEGLMLYCTDCCDDYPVISFYNGSEWKNIPNCPDPAPPTVDDIVKKSAKVSLNSDYFATVIGDDGNLYSWGNETRSGYRAMGTGILNYSNKKPLPIVNPTNIKFSQVSTGHHGLAIALSSEGYVYGAGLTNRGAGNLNDPSTFKKIVLTGTDPKARLIGVSEGGVVCIGQNDKSYIWGYGDGNSLNYFGAWNSIKPVERPLPTNVASTDVIAIGGSFHFVTIATENKIYFTGSTNLGISAKGQWFEHPAVFNKIKSLKVGRDIIIIEDKDGIHSVVNHLNKQTINTTVIPEKINNVVSNGSQKAVFAVTDTKIYYSINPTTMIGATSINAPAGYKIIGFAPAKILDTWCLVLLEDLQTGDYAYYGFNTTNDTNLGNNYICNFSYNSMIPLGLDLSALPTDVKLTW